MRQPLHISIDPSPYHQFSSNSSSPSTSSAHPSPGTTATSPASTLSDGILCSVLCIYDFQSSDPAHLSFHKNEILDIIKQEDSGWWAAMRKGGDIVGWIPQAFVKSLTEEMAERLWNVREELRVYEYEAEKLYLDAPTSRIPFDEDPDPAPVPNARRYNGYRSDGESRRDNRRQNQNQNQNQNQSQWMAMPPEQQHQSQGQRQMPTSSPATPQPVRYINKPTPPTPNEFDSIPDNQATSTSTSRRPLPPVANNSNNDNAVSPESGKRSVDKIKQLTGHEEALDFYKANLVWYLKPRFGDQLQIDDEGRIISGTRLALAERLVWSGPSRDPIKSAEDNQYRRIFLTTFRTFMTADQLFDMLVENYRMEYPKDASNDERKDWEEKRQYPTRCFVLTTFTMWLEEQRLLEEEPHIAGRLTDFVKYIGTGPFANVADGIFQTIERLTFANPPSDSPVKSPSRGRRKKQPKNDLLRLDCTDVAEQLSLLEYRLYAKITPQECLALAKCRPPQAPGVTGLGSNPPPKSCSTTNLTNFCATHDKLAAWVTSTILNNDQLSRRADTVDFWIKVAEKCRNMNNFASMSAIINALSSTVVARLHLTWAHVGRKNNLDTLLRYNKPTGGFSGYRKLQLQAEGPCVPFVGMYMTDIVHIKDQFSDDADIDGKVSFIQRQRWYEVVKVMLRFQQKAYPIAENEMTMRFISNNMRELVPSKDWQQRFWQKSQEVQQSELAHADIRRGLEAAGF